MLTSLAAFLLVAQPDTVVLGPEVYLDRVLTDGPTVRAARLRAESAEHAARQAAAWTNPSLDANVDNVGAEREVTGIDGIEGVEGQAVLTFRLPLGGDRSARASAGRGAADEAAALARLRRLEAAAEAAGAVAAAQRDARLAESAREELDALLALADALSAQADAGRAADADAARARLEAAAAREAWAVRRAAAAASAGEVARWAGVEAGVPVRVRAIPCVAPGADSPLAGSPRLEAAEARVRSAEALESLAAARRIPDLAPQVGVRRTMGVEALYAGVGITLPLFDRGGRRLEAARASRDAAAAEAADERRRIEAEIDAARAAYRALDEARPAFTTPEWEADLERVIVAARARLDLGEGTLAELLEVRRARLRALEARERWAAAWREARARRRVLEGRTPTPTLFCDPLARETP